MAVELPAPHTANEPSGETARSRQQSLRGAGAGRCGQRMARGRAGPGRFGQRMAEETQGEPGGVWAPRSGRRREQGRARGTTINEASSRLTQPAGDHFACFSIINHVFMQNLLIDSEEFRLKLRVGKIRPSLQHV